MSGGSSVGHKTQLDLAPLSAGLPTDEVVGTERASTVGRGTRYPHGASELAAVLAECGCSRAQLARHLGCSPSLIDQFVDGSKPLSLDVLARCPLGIQIRIHERALERAKAERDGRLTPMPLVNHALRSTQMSGELAGDVAEAIADGVVTPTERVRLAKTVIRIKTHAEHMLRDLDVRAVGGGR